MLTVDDLTPREVRVFVAACAQEDAHDGTGKPQVIHDPEYISECRHLTELGLLEAVEVEFAGGERELAGYRLSCDAALAHNMQREIENAQSSVN